MPLRSTWPHAKPEMRRCWSPAWRRAANGATARLCSGNSLLKWRPRRRPTTSTRCCSTCALQQPYYSLSFATLVLLDAVAIMRSTLGDQYSAVKQLRALDQIWHGSLLLLTSLEKTFLSEKSLSPQEPDSTEVALWEQRLDHATALLEAAGLCTVERSDARAKYVELRTQWNGHIQRLAPSMLYSMQEIDTATYGAARRHDAFRERAELTAAP